MSIPRWSPSIPPSRQKKFLLKRCSTKRKLFVFLRERRHEIFDEATQAELESMYRDTGAGKEAVAPALMAMALILQGYSRVSDAEAVELSVVDLHWQMVLDRQGETEPAFSQGALFDFRERLIANDVDRRLLERTAELARSTQGFDWKKLPKTLRIAVDSSPLEGAGRVEDTLNLIGHAARKVVRCVAQLLDAEYESVCKKAGIPATDLKSGAIVACAVTPANQPEHEALPQLKSDIDIQHIRFAEAHFDRGYMGSPTADELEGEGATLVCKPWRSHNTKNQEMFTKEDFDLNLRSMTLTCPAGQTQPINGACQKCVLQSQCTSAKSGRGRSVLIAEDEPRQEKLRRRMKSKTGRQQFRERVPVEHRLAHLSQRQGNRARYRGVRKNLYDTRRAAAIQNLEIAQRKAA